MTVSKEQKRGVLITCMCGCEETVRVFPVYDLGKGKGLRTPQYKRGHHPNCHKGLNTKNKPSWNKGLTKATNPGVARQGARKTKHHAYIADQHPDWFSEEFDHVSFFEKYGQKPRSKGGSKVYTRFRHAIMKRDNFTCQHCGMEADAMEDLDLLNVHHIVYVKKDKTRIFDHTNVITLCYFCHRKVHRKVNKLSK